MSSTKTSATNEKTYNGGCHCGLIRYTVDLDFAKAQLTKCNCSICLKANLLIVRLQQPEKFKLLSPGSWADAGDLLFGQKTVHHYFCKTCGIHCVQQGTYEFKGVVQPILAINAVTLDQGQGVDFRKSKIAYWDGKTDNWEAGTKDEPFEGGCF